LTDEFIFYPGEFIGNFVSINSLASAKFRPQFLSYLFDASENTVTIAGVNKIAP
jgi:hypothetical protein